MRFAFRSIVSFQAPKLSILTLFSYAALALGAFLATYSEPALAYVGPPAALGTIGAVLGLGMALSGMAFHAAMRATRRALRGLPAIFSTRSLPPPSE
jgi:hypothetical protein